MTPEERLFLEFGKTVFELVMARQEIVALRQQIAEKEEKDEGLSSP